MTLNNKVKYLNSQINLVISEENLVGFIKITRCKNELVHEDGGSLQF